MSTRAEREKCQSLNEKHKNILAKFIAKEDNKFCADCLAKGPRWVSWNLGVLLCIKCSGIHRSLGVHISKVKSVNLDTWTPAQLQHVLCRGNGWAKDYYECRLPNDFKRPSGNAMEYFIRDKYEKKKYISPIPIATLPIDEYGINDTPEEKPKKKKEAKVKLSPAVAKKVERPPSAHGKPVSKPAPVVTAAAPKPVNNPPKSAVEDLLGLDSFVQAPPANTTAVVPQSSAADLTFDIFQSAAPVSQAAADNNQQTNEAPTSTSDANKKLSKDSILSLYAQNPPTTSMNNFFSTQNTQAGYAMNNAGGLQQQQGFPQQQQQQSLYQQPQQPQQYQQQQYQQFQQASQNQWNPQFNQHMMGNQQPQQLYNQMQNMNINNQGNNYQGLTNNNAANHNAMFQTKTPAQNQPYQNNQAFGNWNMAASGHTLSTNLWK